MMKRIILIALIAAAGVGLFMYGKPAIIKAAGVVLKSECGNGSSSEVCFWIADASNNTLFSVTPTVATFNVPVNVKGQWEQVSTPTGGLSQTPTSGQCAIGIVLVASVPHVAAQCFPSGGSLGSLLFLDSTVLGGYIWTAPLNITTTGGAVSGTTAAQFQPQRALVLTGIQFSTVNAVLSCSTYPQLQVYDTTAGAPLNSGFVVGPGFTDDGTLSISIPSGHLISLRIDPTHLGSGCSNSTFNTQVNLIYN